MRREVLRAFGAAVAVAATPVSGADYRVTFDPESVELRVEACVAQGAEALRFSAQDARAPQFLKDATRAGGVVIERDGGTLLARDWRAGECLSYRVDAARIAAQDRGTEGTTVGDDYVLPPDEWLWRPAGDGAARVAFTLPHGWGVTTPWRPAAADKVAATFVEHDTRRDWPALIAIGPLLERTFTAGAGTLRFAALGTPTRAQEGVLARYANEVARDIAASLPHAFVASPQLVTIPVGRAPEAVPFGQSLRGGGTGIVLYVDPTRSHGDYHESWTLTHELVHAAHPYLGDDGRWISEGIATYYQNVIRARRGRHSALDGWQELAAGFERGRTQGASLTLRETSRRMDAMRLYMRGYWSGTALALLADVALRTRAENPSSLDAAVDGFALCCLGESRRWRAHDYLRALDREAGGTVLASLYDAHADASTFPDVGPAWAALGITVDGDRVVLDSDPAHAALRAAIMARQNRDGGN